MKPVNSSNARMPCQNYENDHAALEPLFRLKFRQRQRDRPTGGRCRRVSRPRRTASHPLGRRHETDPAGHELWGAPHGAGYENLRTANWIYTAPNITVVWIKEEGRRPPPYESLVSDRANTGCVNIERRQGSFVNVGVSLQSFVLTAFPRWDTETILRVRPYRGVASPEQFVLTNPTPGTIARWTPEPLPATRSAGDLEVTLTKLIAGAPVPYREGGSPAPTNDPANQCVHLILISGSTVRPRPTGRRGRCRRPMRPAIGLAV